MGLLTSYHGVTSWAAWHLYVFKESLRAWVPVLCVCACVSPCAMRVRVRDSLCYAFARVRESLCYVCARVRESLCYVCVRVRESMCCVLLFLTAHEVLWTPTSARDWCETQPVESRLNKSWDTTQSHQSFTKSQVDLSLNILLFLKISCRQIKLTLFVLGGREITNYAFWVWIFFSYICPHRVLSWFSLWRFWKKKTFGWVL